MVVDGNGSTQGKIHGDGGEMCGWNGRFPLGDKVLKKNFVDDPEIGEYIAIESFKCFKKTFFLSVAAGCESEQAELLVRGDNEAVILIEVVQQE